MHWQIRCIKILRLNSLLKTSWEKRKGKFYRQYRPSIKRCPLAAGTTYTNWKMPLEKTRLKEIESVAQRTNPGAGGFYDNFGSPASWARIKSDVSWSNDPGSLISPRVSFGLGLKDYFDWMQNDQEERHNIEFAPKAWMSQATTLYDQPLIIVYDHLDPQSSYVIRVTYTGRFNSKWNDGWWDSCPRLYKTGIQPVYEFAVPPEAVADGVVEFKWGLRKWWQGFAGRWNLDNQH